MAFSCINFTFQYNIQQQRQSTRPPSYAAPMLFLMRGYIATSWFGVLLTSLDSLHKQFVWRTLFYDSNPFTPCVNGLEKKVFLNTHVCVDTLRVKEE